MRMTSFLSILFLAGLLSSPVSALAQSSAQAWSYTDIDLGRYGDSPWDRPTNVAVSALTRMDVLLGNPDGTYRPFNHLNRAEFVTIAMRMIPDASRNYRSNCFPDVAADAWYAQEVCRAKALGIVQGNVEAGLPASDWRFQPASSVQYEEAVKVLSKVFAMPIDGTATGMNWFVPYMRAAGDAGVDIAGLTPGDLLTRGEMARLAIAFYANSRNELTMLHMAQYPDRYPSSMSSSRFSVSSRSSASSNSSMSSWWPWSGSSASRDPNLDVSVDSSVLVLGDTSSVLAAVEVRSSLEPLMVDTVTVEFDRDVESIESVRLYDETGWFIATATPYGGTRDTFRASIPQNGWMLEKGEQRSFYLRANLKDDGAGGVSGETVRVDRVIVQGTGEWSNNEYNSVSTDTFLPSETARAGILSIEHIGDTEAALFTGDMVELATFRFRSESNTLVDPRITELRFRIEQNGGVTLQNAMLRTQAGSQSPCTVSGMMLVCSAISSDVGNVNDEKVIRVYADVDVPASSDNAYLRITLQEPGYPSQPGDITWTDGSTTFTWVDLDAPLARGTLFRR